MMELSCESIDKRATTFWTLYDSELVTNVNFEGQEIDIFSTQH